MSPPVKHPRGPRGPECKHFTLVENFKRCCRQGQTGEIEWVPNNACPVIAEKIFGPGLASAITIRQLDVARTFLRGGALTTSPAGTEALIEAVRTGSVALVSLMLEHGANPNAVGPTGQAAIHVAVIKTSEPGPERFQVVTLLLQCGADPNCMPTPPKRAGPVRGPHLYYGTPTQLAVAWGRRKVVLLLAAYGADSSQTTIDVHRDRLARLPLRDMAKEAGLAAELDDAISIGAHAAWSPRGYSTYQEPMRAAIKTLLLVQHRLGALEEPRLVAMPPEMWTLINGFVLPRQWPSVVKYPKPTVCCC